MMRPVRMRRIVTPIGGLHFGAVATLQQLCFPEDPWSAGVIGQIMGLSGSFGFLAVETSGDGAAAGRSDEDAAAEGVPIGYVLARAMADEAEVISIGVASLLRGRRHGAALLRAAMARAVELGGRRLYLEVAQDNAAAHALYAAAGFVSVGLRPGYYRRGRSVVDALIYRVDLEAGMA